MGRVRDTYGAHTHHARAPLPITFVRPWARARFYTHMRATKTTAPQRVRSSPSGFHDEADATRRIVHVQLTGESGAKHVRPPMPARKLRLARPRWCPYEGSPYTQATTPNQQHVARRAFERRS